MPSLPSQPRSSVPAQPANRTVSAPPAPRSDIAEKYLGTTAGAARGALPRVLQFTSEDRFTKYEMCGVFAEIMGLSTAGLEPDVPSADADAGAVQRPYDTHLSTRELQALGVSVATLDFVAWWRWNVRAFRK